MMAGVCKPALGYTVVVAVVVLLVIGHGLR